MFQGSEASKVDSTLTTGQVLEVLVPFFCWQQISLRSSHSHPGNSLPWFLDVRFCFNLFPNLGIKVMEFPALILVSGQRLREEE